MDGRQDADIICIAASVHLLLLLLLLLSLAESAESRRLSLSLSLSLLLSVCLIGRVAVKRTIAKHALLYHYVHNGRLRILLLFSQLDR